MMRAALILSLDPQHVLSQLLWSHVSVNASRSSCGTQPDSVRGPGRAIFRAVSCLVRVWSQSECIDGESCDTRVKGHPKEFHVNRRSRKSSKK